MAVQMANAFPKKTFFIQMFTKDISLEDCILDLLDNSIDGLIRSSNLRLADISRSIFNGNGDRKAERKWTPLVSVDYSQEMFTIQDNCGGIELDFALNEAFNFGHSLGHSFGYLGAYGVGLKRALFKIGRRFHIESKTLRTGFTCDLDVDQWVARDNNLDDWRIPLEEARPAAGQRAAGTRIQISQLHEEVKMRLQDRSFARELSKAIERTYAFFLKRYVRVEVNGSEVTSPPLPVGKPKGGEVSFEKIETDGVTVRIIATVAQGDEQGHLVTEKAGWYIVCNGRVVLAADKSETTGWGVEPNPQFMPKHRGFIGFVFFESQNPLMLPWTTTKRDLNRESAIYLHVKNRMAVAARPVIAFCNRKYGPDRDEEPIEREISRGVARASFGELVRDETTSFRGVPLTAVPKSTVTVRFEADIADVDKIRKSLRKPHMGAGAIGKYTFEYFMSQEGLK